jgi:hypothetical protein
MKNMKRGLIVLIGVASFGVAAQTAVHSYFTAPSGDWNVAANWDSGVVPNGSDAYAHIRKSATVTISTKTDQISRFQLGDSSGSEGTLNIVDGGSLSGIGSSEVGRMSAVNSIGRMNISGGYYRSGVSVGSQYLKVGVDTAGKPATGMLTISGGKVESKLMVGSTGVTGATPDTLRIEGSAATVFSDVSASSGDALVVGQSGIVEFVFGENGISCPTYKKSPATFNAGSQIVIDGTAYTGGPKTLKLIDAVSLGDESATAITLKGFKLPATHKWDKISGDLTVTVGP